MLRRYLHKVCDETQTHRVSDIEDYVESEMVKYIKAYGEVIPETINQEAAATEKQIEEIDAKINNLVLSLEEAGACHWIY